MGIRSLSAASISTGAKRSKFWDQVASIEGPSGFYGIDSYTFPNSSLNTITFSNIPQDYKHLYIVYNCRGTINDGTRMYFNGDFTNGNYYGNGGWGVPTSGGQFTFNPTAGNGIVDLFGLLGAFNSYDHTSGYGYINDYSKSDKLKSASALMTNVTSTSEGSIIYSGGTRTASTAAISSITFTARTQNFVSGSKIAIFGIR
jgi:hypothetical protein